MENSASSAAARVFGIVELLENILVNVEVFDLFVIQRVNSTFRDVIAGSASLRELMHLEPKAVTDDIDVAARRNFLVSRQIKDAIFPFEVVTLTKVPNNSTHLLRVRCAVDYRDGEAMDSRQRLDLLNFADASWRNIQIGASNQQLQLCIAGGRDWRTRAKFTTGNGADLGCVVKALCESITVHWRWRAEHLQDLASMPPFHDDTWW